MFSLDAAQGAWRIEQSPDCHEYGFPNTHWLIVGDRVKVIRDAIRDPRVFDMRIYFDWRNRNQFTGLIGKHAGPGHAEVDGDLLFISFGKNGVVPPRFASDCGLFFAFTRDPNIPLPKIETVSENPIDDAVLGRFVRRAQIRGGEWAGSVTLGNGVCCEVSIEDYLRPIDLQISKVKDLVTWINDNIDAIQTECGVMVREWSVPENQEFDRFPIEHFARTVTVSSIVMGDCQLYLWARTSISIDHSLRVWLDDDPDQRFVIRDVSVEG